MKTRDTWRLDEVTKQVIASEYADPNMRLKDIAERHGVSRSSVRRIALKTGIESRPWERTRGRVDRTLDERDALITRQYEECELSLQEIADLHGVTYQRVVQIARKTTEYLGYERTRIVNAFKADQEVEPIADNVVETYVRLPSVSKVSESLGLPERIVNRALGMYDIPASIRRAMTVPPKKHVSDEQLFEAMRFAAEHNGTPGELHWKAYRNARDEYDIPSEQTIRVRWGSFEEGVRRAGLMLGTPVPRVTEEQMLQAVVFAAKVLGRTPTSREFVEMRKDHPNLLGLGVYSRRGGWLAWVRRAEAELGWPTPVRH